MDPQRRHLSPAAERRQGDQFKARVGLIVTTLLVLVTGMLLYYWVLR